MSNKRKDDIFYQSKFDYYRTMNMWVAVICDLSSVLYLLSDWYLLGGFDPVTLPARLSVWPVLAVFLFVNARVRDYRVMVPMSYLVAHSIMWGTIGACAHLPDLTYASDGFIVIMAVFIFFGFAAPAKWSIVFTGLLFADIAVANTFLHYPEYAMMLMLGIPFYLGICLVVCAVEQSYLSQYVTKLLLEESAYHDQLTGIYNRNILSKITRADKSLSCFTDSSVSMLLFDIDYFKRVNDTYGHDGGDVVLKEVVQLAASQLTAEHYMIRWGGEEFLVILKQPLEATMQTAEHIRQAVEQNTGKICPVTVSVGVTEYRIGDYNETVQRADRALYHAKNSGRNCVMQVNLSQPGQLQKSL